MADWGGEWTGLDAAEVLRAAGHEVELACGAVHPGETVHQYSATCTWPGSTWPACGSATTPSSS